MVPPSRPAIPDIGGDVADPGPANGTGAATVNLGVQVVEDRHPLSPGDQSPDEVGTDESGPPRDEDIHCGILSS